MITTFQLTPSRRATKKRKTLQKARIFQLTPSRRATHSQPITAADTVHFNSRPHGGRLQVIVINSQKNIFQLTPSRRATLFYNVGFRPHDISTHALTEGDELASIFVSVALTFQLTPSRRATSAPTDEVSDVAFQLTPSRRATKIRHRDYSAGRISTHALTEGDGKFRQIFLLNRGYAYSISLYFLPHFISLLPQILSFQQKSFKFQVRIFLLFSVHLAFALQNQCVHHVKYRFCTNMFYFVFVLFTQIVKPQTIGLFIYDFF